mgnify:FL=1
MISTLLALAFAGKPPISDHPGFVRWMAHKLVWGTLSTTSARSDGTTPGTAFGNPYSFADVAGVPYIYASDMDGSMIDAFGSASTSSRATL